MFQKRFFSSKKEGVIPLDVTETNNIYYRVCNILIKPAKDMTAFINASESVTVKPEDLNKCVKFVSAGLNQTLVIILGENTGLSSNLVILEEDTQSEKTINAPYIALPEKGYKLLENVILYTAAKVERKELTTMGTLKFVDKPINKAPGVGNFQVIEVVEVDAAQLADKIFDAQSYSNFSRVFDAHIPNPGKKVEIPNTRVLRSDTSIEKKPTTSLGNTKEVSVKPTLNKSFMANSGKKVEIPNTRVLRSDTSIEKKPIAIIEEEAEDFMKFYKCVKQLEPKVSSNLWGTLIKVLGEDLVKGSPLYDKSIGLGKEALNKETSVIKSPIKSYSYEGKSN